MKKSTFTAMILGTIGGILFALGMCMALIPEWDAFRPGVAMGVIGAAVLLIMVLVWRKIETLRSALSIAHDNNNRIDHRGCTVFYKIGRRKDRH